MLRHLAVIITVGAALASGAAERKFDFSKFPTNQPPKGFRSVVTGEGQPGDWRILLEDVPPLIKPLSPQAPAITKQSVLAQLATDKTDEHFPLLIADDEVYGDFTASFRFKTVSGEAERMAGLAFRIQDEKNYYVLRASSKGNTLRFYKFVEGKRSQPVGPDIAIPSGVWHQMTVEGKGNQIRCLLNGQEAMPMLTDNTFPFGKIGFWTKSDSVSYFADLKLTYTPRILPAQTLIKEIITKYPRLVGLKIIAKLPNQAETKVIAASNEADVGAPATEAHLDVIARGVMYTGKERKDIVATLPLHDRNGDVVAAVAVTMSPFPGQTDQNAIIRATPIVKEMEQRITAAKDLVE